jgi:hypothetical protein
MIEDERLGALLRAALPPAAPSHDPPQDLWPSILRRAQEPQPWSWGDLAVAVGVVLALALSPRLFLLLVYHL